MRATRGTEFSTEFQEDPAATAEVRSRRPAATAEARSRRPAAMVGTGSRRPVMKNPPTPALEVQQQCRRPVETSSSWHPRRGDQCTRGQLGRVGTPLRSQSGGQRRSPNSTSRGGSPSSTHQEHAPGQGPRLVAAHPRAPPKMRPGMEVCGGALETCGRAAEARQMRVVRPHTPHRQEQEEEAALPRTPPDQEPDQTAVRPQTAQELEPEVEAARLRAPPEHEQVAAPPPTAQEPDQEALVLEPPRNRSEQQLVLKPPRNRIRKQEWRQTTYGVWTSQNEVKQGIDLLHGLLSLPPQRARRTAGSQEVR
ncbi:hypothetical protein CRENBAI_017074 [Crenichthys baileyi]|uniref:Uncharacterized protein n=1 Tax=Crenichthys baileyi TaxID=28760 RepID=A0AAV9R9V8_9TELE